jgi:hypothetical protein
MPAAGGLTMKLRLPLDERLSLRASFDTTGVQIRCRAAASQN